MPAPHEPDQQHTGAHPDKDPIAGRVFLAGLVLAAMLAALISPALADGSRKMTGGDGRSSPAEVLVRSGQEGPTGLDKLIAKQKLRAALLATRALKLHQDGSSGGGMTAQATRSLTQTAARALAGRTTPAMAPGKRRSRLPEQPQPEKPGAIAATSAPAPAPAPSLKPSALTPSPPTPSAPTPPMTAPAPSPLLAYAPPQRPDDSDTGPFSGIGKLLGRTGLPGPASGIAVYDISAATVYMPDGTKLEAHSGIGHRKDKPKYAYVKNLGPTPPNIYKLRMRERRFHGVEAIRMLPMDRAAMKGRDGMLAHTPLLRRSNGSHGCVAFTHYNRFLKAFKRGEVKRMIVVPSIENLPVYMAKLDRRAPT